MLHMYAIVLLLYFVACVYSIIGLCSAWVSFTQVVALGGLVCDSGSDVASFANKANPLPQLAQKESKDGKSVSEEEEDRTGIVACTHVIAIDLKRSETMFLAILLGKPVWHNLCAMCELSSKCIHF